MTKTFSILLLVALAAACASTPLQREVQIATAIKTANDTTALALDHGILKADDGEAIQMITRAATAELRRAVAARRAGEPRDTWERILDTAQDLLRQASAILAGRNQ